MMDTTVNTRTGSERAVVSAGIVSLLMIWFALAAALFVFIFYLLYGRVQNDEQFTRLLGHIMWPYVLFALSVPTVALFARHIGGLLGLRNDIKKIPEDLADALAKAEQLKESIEEISARAANNLNEVFGMLDSKVAVLEDRLREFRDAAPHAQVLPHGETLRERLNAHLEQASERFYAVLEKWNSDRRRSDSILVVTRGGGNRPELVDKLQEAGVFARTDARRNAAMAEYLREVFRTEMGSRRGGVQVDRIGRLDVLREQLGEQ